MRRRVRAQALPIASRARGLSVGHGAGELRHEERDRVRREFLLEQETFVVLRCLQAEHDGAPELLGRQPARLGGRLSRDARLGRRSVVGDLELEELPHGRPRRLVEAELLEQR